MNKILLFARQLFLSILIITITCYGTNASLNPLLPIAAQLGTQQQAAPQPSPLLKQALQGHLHAIKSLMEAAKKNGDWAAYLKWHTVYNIRRTQDAYCTKEPQKHLPYEEPCAENRTLRAGIETALTPEQRSAIMQEAVNLVAAIAELPSAHDIFFINAASAAYLTEKQKHDLLRQHMIASHLWPIRRKQALEFFQTKLPKKQEQATPTTQQLPPWAKYIQPSKKKAPQSNTSLTNAALPRA